MNILFVASEVVPFAKTGGLADVASALPKALALLGHDVRIVLPLYQQVTREAFGLKPTEVTCSVAMRRGRHGQRTARMWEATLPQSSVITYFVECAELFDRPGLYQQADGKDFPDNLERFSLFSQAALAMLPRINWPPDVVHVHDWQASLASAHLAFGSHAREPFFASTATALTVHNLAYQGLFPRDQWALTHLPGSAFRVDRLEFYGKINCLKGGLVAADVITTVSPTYAREIQTEEFGCGLDGVLRGRAGDVLGILNGIDPGEWNPQTDPDVPAQFSVEDLSGKSRCKAALQRSQRLPETPVLLIGMIQRLAEQKGIDIFMQAVDRLMALPLQLVILGTGDPAYHEQLQRAAQRFPSQLAVNLKFDNALAHQIEAGADAFLMPSRFEPCGLNQLYSMRYGAVPIVRKVGGLADTVDGLTPDAAPSGSETGFVFDEYTSAALVDAVQRAVTAFADHGLWARLMRMGMQQDFSWTRSARDYVNVYERALAARAGPLQPAV